jgi:hypothetical protein
MVTYRMSAAMLALFILLCVAGCEALGLDAPDAQATLHAQSTTLAQELTRLPADLAGLSTQVAATAVYAETYVARLDGVSRQMIATLRAAMPPTPQVVQGRDGAQLPGGAGSLDDMAAMGAAGTPFPGIVTFSAVQTARAVNEADGCVLTPAAEFGLSDGVIYATARATNMLAGTEMSVEWSFGGQVVYSFNFVVDVDDADYCLWFSITPDDVPFTPGDWAVSILANGAAVAPPVSFTIVDAM